MELTDEDLIAMMSQISLSMLGLELSARPIEPGPFDLAASVTISADDVPIVDVQVECDADLAGALATAMFSVPTSELSQADIVDALGELANIVGGNVKGILSLSTELSLPVVTESAESELRPEGDGSHRVGFRVGPHRLRVMVSYRELAA